MVLEDETRGRVAEHLLAVREMRSVSFPDDLFDEYAWVMLLHLFSEWSQKREITAPDLIRLADVPESIGIRYLARLVSAGLINAHIAPQPIEITSLAITKMRTFIDVSQSIYPLPV